MYGINEGSSDEDTAVLHSSLVNATLRGIAGGSTITIGGCDYHDGSQTTGDAKDLQVGQEMGRAVELAYRLQKPLFLQVITDGGCYSREGARNWAGDSVDKTLSLVGYYDPRKVPEVRRKQLGSFTVEQGAYQDHLIGQGNALAAGACLANYLNVQGRLGEFQNIAPGLFSSNQLDELLCFDS